LNENFRKSQKDSKENKIPWVEALPNGEHHREGTQSAGQDIKDTQTFFLVDRSWRLAKSAIAVSALRFKKSHIPIIAKNESSRKGLIFNFCLFLAKSHYDIQIYFEGNLVHIDLGLISSLIR